MVVPIVGWGFFMLMTNVLVPTAAAATDWTWSRDWMAEPRQALQEAWDGVTRPAATAQASAPAPRAARVVVRVYPEGRPDGSEWEVTQWSAAPFYTEKMAKAAPAAPASAASNRHQTGKGNSQRFPAGVPVVGYKISLDNGRVLMECFLPSAPSAGTVLDGVWGDVFPGEQSNPCQ